MKKNTLLLTVFIHKDLSSYDEKELYSKYFHWLRSEIQAISGRSMKIIMVTADQEPDICSYNYKFDYADQSLWGIMDTIEYYAASEIPDYDPHIHKLLLLTCEPINRAVSGIALQGGSCAIASIYRQSPAHEVGHMLNARHEYYEVLYNGGFDETIMVPDDSQSRNRGFANRFSDHNRGRIFEYLEQFD